MTVSNNATSQDPILDIGCQLVGCCVCWALLSNFISPCQPLSPSQLGPENLIYLDSSAVDGSSEEREVGLAAVADAGRGVCLKCGSWDLKKGER